MPTEDIFPELRINLVELKDWKPYDPSDKIMEWSSEAAFEALHHMSSDDLETYVNDLTMARGKRGAKPRRRFTSEEIEWLAQKVKEGDPLVEETRHAIQDAMTWMYEAAYMPNQSDVDDSMEDAGKSVINDLEIRKDIWDPVLSLEEERRGPKEWSPRKKVEAKEILSQLVSKISLEQKEGHYDRYLVTNFLSAQVTKDLLSRSHWQRAMLQNALGREFKDLVDVYLGYFFDFLKRTMEDLDIENRADWRAAWRSMLNSGIAPAVQKEMAEALKEMPAESEREDGS